MRRAIIAAVSVLVLGGVTAVPAFAAEYGADNINGTVKAEPATHAKAKTVKAEKSNAKETKKTAALKTITYHGYEFRVPAPWPVYRLDEHPSTCVRYDLNAVYLGMPGVSMACPAGLVGRTQTITVMPGVTVATGSGAEITYQRQRQRPDGLGAARAQSLKRVHATVTDDAGEHELRAAVGAAALAITVLATYGTDPALDEQVLSTLRLAPKGAADTGQTGPSAALSAPARSRAPVITPSIAAAIVAARAQATGLRLPAALSRSYRRADGRTRATAVSPQSTSWPGVPPDWPVQIVSTPPNLAFKSVSGFDACSAPPLGAMRAWRRDYTGVGIYIGGLNRTCRAGNLSAGWIRTATAMGWRVLPVYVGLQAPCSSGVGLTINPTVAAAQGTVSAAVAIKAARDYGLGDGATIYYDMESYIAAHDPGCISAVLTYLGAWDRAVAAAGFQTGIYSSQATGIADVDAAMLAKTPGFTAPDQVWDANWDARPSLSNLSLEWPLPDRAKQYWGGHWVTVGHYTLNIDSDEVGSLVAR